MDQKYSAGDRIYDDLAQRSGKIVAIGPQDMWGGGPYYEISWQAGEGTRTHRIAEIDEDSRYRSFGAAPTMQGRERGECDCGSWAVPGFEGLHTKDCKVSKNNQYRQDASKGGWHE
jgi:hypothetical protein